ncbi:MAG: methyltransferase domain-containing protein [Hydrococcus sp. Prado102]|jgi:2-polyprenyl-3-methyl-5-hydroxy-6-metoxy-1,4-benzoquinol methylase|nr:methyltransferase domain-containing protein [Hydrococcus sp. Prado102]
MDKPREFPNWEQLYQEQQVESMPWFHSQLDPNLDRALTQLNIHNGTCLDIGTGPGTQAMALAQRGFQVTASDLSETAIAKASQKAKEKGLAISWQQDDILNSQLKQEFDFVFDRGCFHVFPPECRHDYVRVVAGLIKPEGYLFLKTFSVKETRPEGPYRFAPQAIEEIFQSCFHLYSSEETVYQGTLNPLPKALFCVLKKL